ncbi:DUF4350 domain-containing protein [Microbacterium sp. CJ88]|uniref:DUF4350 domain-containing protein n=1 Tax=Microbacterium sp. CJ88 TaxID=3445672 RepID=UPI003F6584D0
MTTVQAPPRRGRAIAGWAAIAAVLLLVGLVGVTLSGAGQWSQRDVLDPESAAPQGARALATILRDQGVDVTVARDRGAARAALAQRPATLVLSAAPALSDGALQELVDAAAGVVLIEPRARDLRIGLPGSVPAGGAGAASVTPGCDLDAARRSGSITPGAGFRPGDAQGCYPLGDGAYALLTSGTAAAIDGRATLTNEHLAAEGNAALGVNLLAARGAVVWYVPSLSDTDLASATPSLGELTPGWVTPAIVVLVAAALAAALWRGRRFGPLVAERLPVTVRASETTEGRARLYEAARDPLHAADQLRAGALERLGRALALGPTAAAPEIADAAADRLRADRGVVRGILLDDRPTTDAQLVALSDRLRDLENAVRAAVRPERNRP